MARRDLGQNFLVDRGAIERIIRALELRETEPVLEIGPGRGALTRSLIAAAGRVAAVEIDRTLVARLRREFDDDRLLLVEADVLSVPLAEISQRLGQDDRPLVVAGNLPYGISKPVVQKLIRERRFVDRAVLMFQREVAERLTAGPGSKRYGPLGVLAQVTFDVRTLFHLPPRSFRPAPKVESSVTSWRPKPGPGLDEASERCLRQVLATCFASRRRTLRNNLRARIPDGVALDALLSETGLAGGDRAEAVPIDGFLRLARAWR